VAEDWEAEEEKEEEKEKGASSTTSGVNSDVEGLLPEPVGGAWADSE
jgi:hypothetical protein